MYSAIQHWVPIRTVAYSLLSLKSVNVSLQEKSLVSRTGGVREEDSPEDLFSRAVPDKPPSLAAT